MYSRSRTIPTFKKDTKSKSLKDFVGSHNNSFKMEQQVYIQGGYGGYGAKPPPHHPLPVELSMVFMGFTFSIRC